MLDRSFPVEVVPSGYLYEMDEYLEHEFDEYPAQLEFEQNLRREVDRGKKKLDEALARAADIPTPSILPKKSHDERLQEIQSVLENRELSRLETEKEDVFHVRLFETPTIFLFEMTPKHVIDGTEEAEIVKKLNASFEEKKSSTDIVKYKDNFSQAILTHTYNELLLTDPIEKKDVACSASSWRLYDAYNTEHPEKVEETEQDVVEEDDKNKNKEKEKKIQELVDRFQQAATVTCRVLSSNTFESQQIEFSKKHQPSRGISYKTGLLWTLSGNGLGRVNKICTNPFNSKIIGVGYGDREGSGTVKIWHVKNPEAAERTVSTKRAVTCVEFSKTQPRQLAATTRDGSVLLVDITNHKPTITVVNKEELKPYPDPLWTLTWAMYDYGSEINERLFTVGESGQLWVWDPIKMTGNKQIAKLSFVAAPDPELNVRFQELLDEAPDSDDEEISPDQYFLEVPYIGLSISVCEPHNVYITTDVGCIIHVNTNRADGGWDRLPGHKLSVFGLERSPFISALYLTYSADGDVCIWINGFHTPLVHLSVSDISLYSIDSSVWSPSHSTILASASREKVCIWDISRKTDRPVATLTGNHYTNICFTKTGTSLLVGCHDGNVLVYRLSEMPHMPYLQKEHLVKALRKALENKPELLKELDFALQNV